MKETGPDAVPPPASCSFAERILDRLTPEPEPPLKINSFLAVPVEDRLHGVVHRQDEAGRALGLFLDAAVEPHRAVEAGLLVHQNMGELVRKGLRIVLAGEVAVRPAPGRDGVHHPADELPDRALPLGCPQGTAKILRAHHVGGHLRPGLGNLHVVLLEYDFPAFVLDGRRADLPFELVIRIGPGLGEIPPDTNALCLVLALAGILAARRGRCGRRDRRHASSLVVSPCGISFRGISFVSHRVVASAVSSAESPKYPQHVVLSRTNFPSFFIRGLAVPPPGRLC